MKKRAPASKQPTNASSVAAPARPAAPRIHPLAWISAGLALVFGAVHGVFHAPAVVSGTTLLSVAVGALAAVNVFALDALRRPTRRDIAGVFLLYELSVILLCWVFPPQAVWPLAFVCLVPWTFATCRAQRAWLVHWLSFCFGWAFFLVSLRWLFPVTGLGYAALGLYLAFYWTLAAWAIRTARRHHISPVWSLPIVWVACEYLRATVMTGFPWLLLGHSLHAQLPLIQISDLVGAYGVSFVALMVNGALVEALLQRWPVPGHPTTPRQLYIGTGVTIALLAGTVGYGFYRLGQVDFENRPDLQGPRVAVIQEAFPLRSTRPYGEPPEVVLARYLALAAEAARTEPDLIVFPETVWSAVQNVGFVEIERAAVDEEYAGAWAYGKLCHNALTAFAQGDYQAVNVVISRLESLGRSVRLPRLPTEGGPPMTVVVGSVSIEQFPEATYPKVRRYNSALVYDPDGSQRRQRYDKRHLVPFGELVPFRQARFLGIDLHYWLYRPLNKLSPFSDGGTIEYSLTPGHEFTAFDLETPKRTYTFGTPICYEDTTPYVIRDFTWDGPERRVDFLVNISNDGWFQYSNELTQHLAICVFRAVENRVSIARAVNTGISGFIDPDGRVYSTVQHDGRLVGPDVIGYDLQPVYLDTRASWYGRFGDWFALTCVVLAAALWVGAIFERWVLAIKHRVEALFRKGGA